VGSLGQVSDSEDLIPLEALSSSELLSIKLGAMEGLRKMRSPHSAKALVERLNDPNPDIRFLAVIALSEIFSKTGDYAPNMAEFDQNPDFYTIKWKTWWAGEARDLGR
jgi:HEAT repeat protein